MVFVLGLVRGQDFEDLFVRAVSLAVAAIPEGLPAVVAFTLAMGAGRLAKRGAIVKRLASVETLGSTSQICTDKTGTLTLNQMTAREMRLAGRRFTVSGAGLRDRRADSYHGRVPAPGTVDGRAAGDGAVHRRGCATATWSATRPRARWWCWPRRAASTSGRCARSGRACAEVPFDSDYKFMATFHRWTDEQGREVVRCFVKGAPDVLAERADRYLGGTEILPLDDAARERYTGQQRLAREQGMRVLAVGRGGLLRRRVEGAEDPKELLDRSFSWRSSASSTRPARGSPGDRRVPRRRHRVRMITGDHAVTAGAIAGELGIPGGAVTGADLDRIGRRGARPPARRHRRVARVSPEHKIRVVRALQARGDVVAMTGDGVNDAPALRRADIGVAMGVTGTEVTKEAATMVLTDDNFATIVGAVARAAASTTTS